jgi:hypothetical protein
VLLCSCPVKAPVQIRQGGNRQLGKVIEDIKITAENMTRGESRSLTELLELILQGQRSGEMEDLVKVLVQKAKVSFGQGVCQLS